ncbi:hypothetical protein nbrc107697_05910 [Gordonia crocea]|uniref:Uncharacterized protein n=1 Tax=Gordonia crocea TaxID=589162 RepID=A0A7M3SV78_9ACTN|nr:hypothetical protein nbrc107697_05910 [Gordonia crocea]
MTGSRSTLTQHRRVAEPPETGLQPLAEVDHRGARVGGEVAARGVVGDEGAQRVRLAGFAELVVVVVDGVEEFDGERVVEEGVGAPGLDRPVAQGPQGGGRDSLQGVAVDCHGMLPTESG